MSDELKPCPFCGFERPHFMEEGHWIYMACESCGCGGPVSTQMRDPSDNWNTRPVEDALRAELAAARAEKLECVKSLEYFVNRMQEERDERIRLEERLKLANATVKFMAEDSGYDSEEVPDEQA